MPRLYCIGLAVTLAIILPMCATAGPYSTDFESFTLGLIHGQDGWVNDNVGTSFIDPLIVNDPTGEGHGKVLRIDPPTDELDYAWSGAFRSCGDLVAEGSTKFQLSWDQWRTGFADILWTVENPDLTGWQSQQWQGSIYPISTSFLPSTDLTAGEWQNIRLVFDASAGTLEGFLDGISFGVATNQNFTTFRGIDFQVMVTWGGVDGPNYIDNVSLDLGEDVPEPSSLMTLIGGLGSLLAVLRRRTR